MKTHWKKAVSDPNFLGEADFQEGEEKVATIDRVAASVEIATAEGKSSKAVVYFREQIKPLILNVTNSKAITKVSGSPYFEDWSGTAIQLYIDPHVRAFGEIVAAVRVRPRKPVPRKAEKCAVCGGDVLGASGKSPEYILQRSIKRFGMAMCFNCATAKAGEQA